MNISLFKKVMPVVILVGSLLTANAALKVGDSLPDLSTFQLEGHLPDTLKGKVVIVDFWASWCLPCAESFPTMDALQKKYGDRLVVLAVNVDEKASNMDKFLKEHSISFTVVRDGKQKLVEVVSPQTMPTSFILDPNGKVCFLHNGFHGAKTREEYIKEIDSLLK
jgi:thiol-disulfide isomerase/thioredoxin